MAKGTLSSQGSAYRTQLSATPSFPPHMRAFSSSLALSSGFLVVALAIAGCSSGDPISPPTAEDVEGNYAITEFTFTPLATGIQSVNVLDTLVTASTGLELFGSRAALFRYRIEGVPADVIAGEFDITATQLRLRLTDPGARLPRLLLPATLTFERVNENTLHLESQITANLAAYDPARFAGLNAVVGTLRLRFERTAP